MLLSHLSQQHLGKVYQLFPISISEYKHGLLKFNSTYILYYKEATQW